MGSGLVRQDVSQITGQTSVFFWLRANPAMYTSTSTWDQRVTADIAAMRLNFRDGGAAPRLMEGEWRDGSYAEYGNFSTENMFHLSEEPVNYFLGNLDTKSKVYNAKSYDI
jgi:hypothetical protein